MFFTQYVSSTFLVIIQLYVYVSVQAATYIQNVNPLIQAPLTPLLQAIPGLISQGGNLVPSVYGQGSFNQERERIMNQVMQPNLGSRLPVTNVLGQQPTVAHPQGNTLQNDHNLLNMLGIINSKIGGNVLHSDITKMALQQQAEKHQQHQQQRQQEQQSDHVEPKEQPTPRNANLAVTSEKDEHVQSGGGSSDASLKEGKGVCEDHPDCALLPLWTCIADEVIWDDCPKMCGQCPKKESDTTDVKLPKPLTPDQLSKQLKPATVPTPPLPNPQLLVSQGLMQPLPAQMTMQQLALANLYGQLQRQQLTLTNLLTQQGKASPNPALQVQPLYNKLAPQLQRVLSPVTTLPQQGILPQQQCICSKLPLPVQSQALLHPQPRLQNIIQHQPQIPQLQQPPLRSLLQAQHQHKYLLQPQSLLQNIIQHQPQALLHSQFPLQILMQPQLLQQLNLQRQLQAQIPSSAKSQQHSSSCQQLTDLLSKIPQANFPQDATPQNPSMHIPNPAPSNLLSKIIQATPQNPSMQVPNPAVSNLLSKMFQTTPQNPSLQFPNPTPSNLNKFHKSLAMSPLKPPNIPLQILNQVQKALPLNMLNANPNSHNSGLNLLHVEKNPLQDILKQLQTLFLIKKLLNTQLASGNNYLQLNALRNLQSQKSLSSPMQILQANVLQNLHNLKTLGSRLPTNHHLGNNKLFENNIINSLLTSHLAMNRPPIKRSTESKKPSGEMGLIKNLFQPINSAIGTKNINANNIPEPSGEMGWIRNLVQPVNSARVMKSINTNNLPGLLDILPGLQTYVQIDPSSLKSSLKTAKSVSRDQNSTTIENISEDAKEMAKQNSLTETSGESQTSSIKNVTMLTLPKREIQLNETLSSKNLRKRNSNSTISESESSADALSEESISRDALSSNNHNGGLLLASQLLKEARSELSTIDNIISSYSTNENEFSKLSSKINEDRSIISQDHIRSDFSFEGIDESGSQNNLEAVERKLNDIRYNDKLSTEVGSIQNLSEIKGSMDNVTQLESLLESRLEAAKKTEESLASVISLNEESIDNSLGVASKLVSEAQSDISKIQDNLKETISLQSVEQKEKLESVPKQNDLLQAANVLDRAKLDLSSINESLRTAKVLNDIKLKHSDSEVINHGDSIDDVLIGSEAEYANTPRVKRVLNDQEFFLDYRN